MLLNKNKVLYKNIVNSNFCLMYKKNETLSLDILTLILNHKKAEYLRNPEIIELLGEINKKKSSSPSELIQN